MENFKQRILTGWTFTRVLYVTMGGLFIAQSTYSQQWFGIIFGAYFAAMGLFAFGCAAGNCFTATKKNIDKNKAALEDVEFEEVK